MSNKLDTTHVSHDQGSDAIVNVLSSTVTVLIGAKVSQIGSAIGIPGPDPSDGGSSELIKVQTSCLSEDKMPRIL